MLTPTSGGVNQKTPQWLYATDGSADFLNHHIHNRQCTFRGILTYVSRLSHLQALEAESIHILRAVASEFQRPVMLYSIGKDSSVMVRLAQKAFQPAPIPVPVVHRDTSYKFKEMIEFRDKQAANLGVKLIVQTNQKALDNQTNPLRVGIERCCGLLKTTALLDGLRAGNFDAAFGGARRDEEKSRPKERV